MTMKKRFVAGMLASAFVLSLGMTAFAEDNKIDGNTTQVEGGDPYAASVPVTVTTNIPTIDVTLPTTSAIIINPYQLEVDSDGEGTMVQSTIVSTEYEIVNASTCPINIDITAAAVASAPEGGTKSTVKVATAPLTGKETDHSVFLYLDTKVGDAAYGSAITLENKTAAATQMILGKSATKEAIMANIAAVDGTANYIIKGEACTKAETVWAATDTVDVSLAFKVVPVAAAVETEAP